MDLRTTNSVASRFAEYIEQLSEVIGHAGRHGPLASYCTGLLLPETRKSVEPMATRVAPDDVVPSLRLRRMTRNVARRPACPKPSRIRPTRRSHSIRPACH